ncbi:transporter, major facilitator family [Synechococcus sp. PCC 7335]|nr:transporter, major facilitator family [Synechococcus sp. PCC 7335]
MWFGQLVSTIGNHMTDFALVLWAWQLTGSATALALVGFFYEVAQLPTALFAGVIVDRCDRKQLMILSDAIAALCTLAIGALYLTDTLLIWHIYLTAAINGGFGQIQRLAYQTSVSLIVAPTQYTRANSMNSAVHYGSSIVSPAFAGFLYPLIQLPGILLIDLATFGIAIITLLFVYIPQPPYSGESGSIIRQLTFGLRHVWTRSELRSLIVITALFWFFHDLGESIYDPMILAQTNGDARVLASTATAAGIGGVTGAIILSAWGGPKQRTKGLLIGFIGAGLSKLVFGLGRSPLVWLPAQFCSSFNFPLLGSSQTALWMEATKPDIQGRVFAANDLIIQIVSALAALLAGPLADRVLEPMMTSPAQPLGYIFGTGAGAGSSILYVGCAIAMLFVGVVSRSLYKRVQ